MAVCYTSEASVDSEQGQEVVPLVYNPLIHPSIHPPIGSEINPFSDRWLVARGLQTEASGCWPWRGQQSKKKRKSPPSPDQCKIIQNETKQKLRLLGLLRLLVAVDEHTFMSLILSLDVCVCVGVTFSH